MSTQPPNRTRNFLDDAEWQAVIDTLRSDGPEAAKLVLARGRTQADGRPARVSTLRDVLGRDPIKRQQWDDAMDEFIARFVAEAHKSAVTPEVIERYDRKTGALVERRTSRRDMNWMLIHVLRKLDPAWRDQKSVTVEGQVQHRHSLDAPSGFVLRPDDIALLPAEDAGKLLELLYRVEDLKLEDQNEHKRELIDAPAWSEAERAEAEQPRLTHSDEDPSRPAADR
jgi:hypothetical protein